jgi:hypothetical protein
MHREHAVEVSLHVSLVKGARFATAKAVAVRATVVHAVNSSSFVTGHNAWNSSH